MKQKMIRWLTGLLSVALIAGNLTYVSAEMPDVDAAGSLTESVSGSDCLQTDDSGTEKPIPDNDDIPVAGSGTAVSVDDAPVSDNGISVSGNDTSVPGNDIPIAGDDMPVAESDASVPESDAFVPRNEVSVSGNDAGDISVLLNSDEPLTLDRVDIAFSRQYQALMINSFGQYYCVDFDECPESECDILFGSKYVMVADLDIYVYSDYQSSWVRCSFNGWELVAGAGNYIIQETNYTEENHAIRQYDPRTYEYGGRTYWLADADLTISGTMSKDPAVWGDDAYHGVSGGCYWEGNRFRKCHSFLRNMRRSWQRKKKSMRSTRRRGKR